jgi:hypothetical protein
MWSGDTAPPVITSEVGGGQFSASHPICFSPGKEPYTHWIGGPLIAIIQSFTGSDLKMITEKYIPL